MVKKWVDKNLLFHAKKKTKKQNKARAISADLLKVNLQNKLEETGNTIWNGKKQEETKKMEEKNTEKNTEWQNSKNSKKQ